MVALSQAFLTLAVFCSSAIAAPWPLTTRQHSHQIRTLSNGLRVKSYHPNVDYQTFGDGIDPPKPANGFKTASFKDSALSFIHEKLGSEQVKFYSGFDSEHGKHYYVHQEFNGIRVANAVAHSSLNGEGKVTAFSSSFVTPQNKLATAPKITEAQAIATVKSQGAATPTGKKVELEYYTEDNGDVTLAHVVQAHMNKDGSTVEFFVDATNNKIIGLINYTHKLTYHVLPITKQSPEEGFETLVDPEDKESSPKGWSEGGKTSGNNVEVVKDDQVGAQSSDKGFEYEYDPNADPSTESQVNLARTNAFYIVNRIHDITYRYGFTEAAFNFQVDNNGKGGEGNDPVQVSVQDSAGTDNADFTTLADGTPGKMRMYLWDMTKPMRDGSLENDIVSHEMTHGITNRLTGGGTGRCLGSDEAGGMGEGWSDSISFWMEQTSADVKPFTMGAFVINQPGGIRSHPYSADPSVNPYTYATISTKNEVHDIGEIWANMLITVYTDLVKKNGFDAKAADDASLTTGNAIWMHLFIDSLSLQPCVPTFITARDAWIQADKNRYKGANTCLLWNSFASKGLGKGATADRVDNHDVPAECQGSGGDTPTDPAPTPSPTSTDDPLPTDPIPTGDPSPNPIPTDDPVPNPIPTDDPLPNPFPTDDPTDPFPTDDPTDPFPFPTGGDGGDDPFPFPTGGGDDPFPGDGGDGGDDPFPFPGNGGDGQDDHPTDLPTYPNEPPLPTDGDDKGSDSETCPLLHIPKSQLPKWWPFDFC